MNNLMTQTIIKESGPKEPILTADDRGYTPAEVKNAIDDLNHKKAPGEDGITGDIPKSTNNSRHLFTHYTTSV